jgi:plasmid stabilization system protein ParE
VTVRYSRRSQRDLANIRDFIEVEAANRQVAEHYIARLLDACDALAILPSDMRPICYASGWRMMPFGSYLVFFQVRGDEVRIGHVRHGARKSFHRHD